MRIEVENVSECQQMSANVSKCQHPVRLAGALRQFTMFKSRRADSAQSQGANVPYMFSPNRTARAGGKFLGRRRRARAEGLTFSPDGV